MLRAETTVSREVTMGDQAELAMEQRHQAIQRLALATTKRLEHLDAGGWRGQGCFARRCYAHGCQLARRSCARHGGASVALLAPFSCSDARTIGSTQRVVLNMQTPDSGTQQRAAESCPHARVVIPERTHSKRCVDW